MKKATLLIALVFLTLTVFSQSKLDSLWGIWNDESATDATRAQALLDVARLGYLYSKPDSAFHLAQLAYDFSNIMELKKEMSVALSIQGSSYYVRGDFREALVYYEKCIEISKEIGDKNGMARILNNMGVMHSNLGEFSKAMVYHMQSLQIRQELSDTMGIAAVRNNMGLIFMNQGDYPRALHNFQTSLKIKETFGDTRGFGQTLNNIGLIYMRQNDSTEALKCFQRSLIICEDNGDIMGQAGVLSNIGLIYGDQKKHAKALEYYQQSLMIQQEMNDKKGIATTNHNIGDIYMSEEEFQKANDYYLNSLSIYEEISDKKGMAGVMINIGRLYNEQKRYNEAIRWCMQGLETAKEMNLLKEQKNACKYLYDSYRALGNDNKALEYHECVALFQDSLQTEETSRKLQQMEFAKQVLADSLRMEEEKLKVKIAHDAEVRKKNTARNIFIASAVVLLIGAIALYRRIEFVRKAKKAIEHEKERSDKLLLNILPSEIAEELKTKGRAEPRKFENVSILFTDFKGFTKISEQLSAEELVGEINTCFESFDSICKKYNIEKIKTIGDSFMAAGGIPIPSEDSARNTVMAGLDMAECMLKMKAAYESSKKIPFEMRIGIHSGPVVAGIAGISKFQYDIWGDTVNTASRIELAGEVGRVNISESTYDLIKDDPDLIFIPRGNIQTKGKGEIMMWFVERNI